MANLGTWTLNPEKYVDISTLGVTFTLGNKYTIQIQGKAYLREGTVGLGFLVDNTDPIYFTASTDSLYISAQHKGVILNIAEQS